MKTFTEKDVANMNKVIENCAEMIMRRELISNESKKQTEKLASLLGKQIDWTTGKITFKKY